MSEIVKKATAPVFPIISTGVATVAVVGAIVFANSNTASINRNVNLGNQYLNEMDYDRAIAAYQEVLEIDEKNEAALCGLMQAAYDSDDYELLSETLLNYVENAVESEDSESYAEVIIAMVENAGEGIEGQDYLDFIDEIKAVTEDNQDLLDEIEEDLDSIYEQSVVEEIIALIEKGDYIEAKDLLLKLDDSEIDGDVKSMYADILYQIAYGYWVDRDYEAAWENIQEALIYEESAEEIQSLYSRIAEEYIDYLVKSQKYDEAMKVVDAYKNAYNIDNYEILQSDITSMEDSDNTLQLLIEELNTYFDNDDISAIEELMYSDKFKNNAKRIHTALYCDSILKSGNLSGFGTAIYNVDGYIYVYYGYLEGGKRSGDGLWYYCSGENQLQKYTITWENDIPNGAGILDSYSTLSVHDVGGREIAKYDIKVNYTFTCKMGVWDGTAHEAAESLGSNDAYEWDFELTDGYAKKIMPGQYPDEILDYLPYPVPLTAYAETSDGRHYWMDWTPWKWSVGGLRTKKDLCKAVYEDVAIIE